MKQLVVILALLFYGSCLHAEENRMKSTPILFLSYHPICIEMFKTANKIGGTKDSAFLKEFSEGRVDSDTVHHFINKAVSNFIEQLMFLNFKNEKVILHRFELQGKGKDSLIAEDNDYMDAQENSTFDSLQAIEKKHPNSKLRSLITAHKKDDKDSNTNYFIIAIIGIIALAVILAMLYLAYELKKSKKSILAMQNQMQRQSDRVNVQGQEDVLTQSEPSEISMQNNSVQVQQPIHEDKIVPQNDIIDMGKINAFSECQDNWTVVGASVIGNSHISMGLPCQDNNKYIYLKNGWGIAITSDGAGSAKHSEIGSRIVVERGIHYFQSVIEQKHWTGNNVLPTEAEWTSIAYTTLKAIRTDLENFAVIKNLELGSLSATIIVVIHSPSGFLTTHVGDGRAGYKDDTGEWKSLIAPHKGEEANQTIFLTSDFWSIPYYVMSSVMVPESHVVKCHPVAFTLMSDGCEHTAWQCNLRNEKTGVFYDPNKPFDRFFNPLVSDLSNNTMNDLKTRWIKFISHGNESFKKEPDDKTMILGVMNEN